MIIHLQFFLFNSKSLILEKNPEYVYLVIRMSTEIAKIIERCQLEGRKILTYEESRNVMHNAGFPLNRMTVAKDLEGCINKSEEIGFPLVLKVVSEDVLHKSDSGGVKVGIQSIEDLKKAFNEMNINVKNHYPEAEIESYSLEEMVEGVELLVGTNTDEQFGKMIAFGIGGIFVEVYKDVSFRLIPVTKRDVLEMIGEIEGKKLFKGYRGKPQVDQSELVAFILRVSELIEKYPQIKEMDLNPVVATTEGLKAIDARIILE